ncbi:MAG: hypothetical protein PUB00_02370 [Clostridiales bacterium]|nr:hypothetical protein [Clostridiales bacterium]
MKKKATIAVVALVLVVCCAIGGAIAWLTDTTAPVTNTFTVGDVDITLTETWNTDTNSDSSNDTWTAKLVPGNTYAKDPVVTVTNETNVDCYLFVKFEESNNANTYLTYTSTLIEENGWTKGDGTNIPADVWYRVVLANDTTKSWNLLDGNKVTVNAGTVTKDTMSKAQNAKLTYTAYAVQKDNIDTAAAAWAKLGA